MGNALLWLLLVELLGLLAFPVAFRLCGYLQDRGYGLSKALGLLLLTYPLWVLGSVGLPMTRPAALLLLAALAALSFALAWRQRADVLAFLRREWRLLLALEAVFLLVFSGWALFRSFDAGINHTEQLMDLGLLSAAATATTFPPQDVWLLGHTVNYYYFGYLDGRDAGRESRGLRRPVAYNLGMALVPGSGRGRHPGAGGDPGHAMRRVPGHRPALRAWGRRPPRASCRTSRASWSSPASEAWAPPPSGRASTSRGWRPPSRRPHGTPRRAGGGGGLPGSSTPWRAASSLDYTIQEFPLFSFILGDLHPHMMSDTLPPPHPGPRTPDAGDARPPVPAPGSESSGVCSS